MSIMSKGHFLTTVAQNALVRTHGQGTADWPPHNFWAMVSTIKSNIKDDQISDLMASYKVTELSDYQPPEAVNYEEN